MSVNNIILFAIRQRSFENISYTDPKRDRNTWYYNAVHTWTEIQPANEEIQLSCQKCESDN